MGYYHGGGRLHVHSRGRLRFRGSGRYYMAGGFFSHLAHVVSSTVGGIVGVVKKAVTLNEKGAALLLSGGSTTNLKQAALTATTNAATVFGAGGVAGRLAQTLAPGAAPAGLPSDGTPVAGKTFQLSTFRDPEAGLYGSLLMASHHHRRPMGTLGRVRIRRRRRY